MAQTGLLRRSLLFLELAQVAQSLWIPTRRNVFSVETLQAF